ncbi:MAG: hypothetical protein PVI75_03160 [Gammaproteobacteria bacterium]|jgi:hypothetical protein
MFKKIKKNPILLHIPIEIIADIISYLLDFNNIHLLSGNKLFIPKEVTVHSWFLAGFFEFMRRGFLDDEAQIKKLMAKYSNETTRTYSTMPYFMGQIIKNKTTPISYDLANLSEKPKKEPDIKLELISLQRALFTVIKYLSETIREKSIGEINKIVLLAEFMFAVRKLFQNKYVVNLETAAQLRNEKTLEFAQYITFDLTLLGEYSTTNNVQEKFKNIHDIINSFGKNKNYQSLKLKFNFPSKDYKELKKIEKKLSEWVQAINKLHSLEIDAPWEKQVFISKIISKCKNLTQLKLTLRQHCDDKNIPFCDEELYQMILCLPKLSDISLFTIHKNAKKTANTDGIKKFLTLASKKQNIPCRHLSINAIDSDLKYWKEKNIKRAFKWLKFLFLEVPCPSCNGFKKISQVLSSHLSIFKAYENLQSLKIRYKSAQLKNKEIEDENVTSKLKEIAKIVNIATSDMTKLCVLNIFFCLRIQYYLDPDSIFMNYARNNIIVHGDFINNKQLQREYSVQLLTGGSLSNSIKIKLCKVHHLQKTHGFFSSKQPTKTNTSLQPGLNLNRGKRQ